MKHSGIEWIGEIPKEWKVARFKFISEMFTGNSLNEHQKEYYSQFHDNESSIPYVSTKDVERDIERINYDGEIRIPESEQGFSIAPKNSVLLCIEGGSAGKKVGYTNQEICFVNKLCCINSNQNSRFIYFFILSNAFNEPFTQNIQGLIGGVSVNSLKNFYITMPPLSEQQKIANYLDKVCGEVDEMIALQEQMIEELKAYKQSVITEAVTKGLNPDVPMKDSGIDWIGEVPEHWNLIHFYKTNWIRARLGWKGLKADEYTETGYPFLSAFNIINDKLVWEDLNFINQERYDESPEIKLSIGDLLLVKDGAGIGKCAVVDELPFGEATVNSSLAVVSPNREIVDSHFQYYYFKSAIFQNTIWLLKIGMGVPHLTQENMRDIIIPNPPLSEQQAIASYLDTKCAEIDALIAIKQAKIEELKDYKKSVIYECVTGKKEVI